MPLSLILLSPVKKSSCLNQVRNMHRSNTDYKKKTVLNKYVGKFWCERTTGIYFFTGGSIIMDYGLILYRSDGLKLNLWIYWWICFLQTCRFSLDKMLTDGLDWCGLLVNYFDVFISCLVSHSDGTHSLRRSHWWASDVMLHFSKSVLTKKQLIYILNGLKVSNFSANVNF